MNPPGACIFDLDGVIVETAQYHYKAWKRLADTLNIPLGEEYNEKLKGVSRRKSLKKILSIDDRNISKTEFKKLMDTKNGWYREYISELTCNDILSGIPEFLDELQKLNVKLAIGSSSKNGQYIVDSLELADRFETVIDGNKVKNSKPDPEVFLKGAEALGVPASDCVVFEDAASGIEAAKAAGMVSVGVGSEDYLGDADLVISSFEDLTPKKLFEKLLVINRS